MGMNQTTVTVLVKKYFVNQIRKEAKCSTVSHFKLDDL